MWWSWWPMSRARRGRLPWPNRQRLDPVDEVRDEPAGRPGEGQAAAGRAHLLVEHPELEPGEVGAEADVRPVAEGDVRVRGPSEVQSVRVGEHALVVVGGGVE